MSQEWIKALRREYDAMQLADPDDPETKVRDAFLRVRAELQIAVEELNKEFPHRFKVDDLEDGLLLVATRPAVTQWTGARLLFDEQLATISSHPTAQVSLVRGDNHIFAFDFESAAFMENGQTVTDEELVRRALDMFLKSALGLDKP